MIHLTKIAFRNILRNHRRSFVTLIAIALGFAAISLFRGYTDNTYEGLRQSAIRGEGIGHLTLYKQGWLEKGKIDPDRYMFTPAEIEKIVALAEADEAVVLATPQIHISGLVSNGRISTIFLAKGVVPADARTIKGAMERLRPVKGKRLDDREPHAVEMAAGLADQLNIKPGQDAVVMSTTLDGQMNALDVTVAGVYDTGSDATNDKFMRFSYDYARALYDTRKADRIVVLLREWQQTKEARKHLLAGLAAAGIPCEIQTWKDLSLFYKKVKGMFDTMFLFIFLIVLIIVVMSVVNTMGMAVLERTREIGTLRALGLKRRQVSFLFAVEGALLGLMGAALGLVFNLGVWAVIRIIAPSYTPPGVSSAVPLIVNLVPGVMVTLAGFLMLLSMLAAILPARRAAGQNVVEALAYA